MDADDKRFLRDETVHGWEIVDGTARLCAMNLLLHGIGTPNGQSLVTVADALRGDPGVRVDVVAANPPFGRKSSMTMVNEAGEVEREDLVIVRDDFWASTSNKQLNFLQHIKTMLKIGGRAAVVLPDNVLFEAGAGETIRRRLLAECDLHTILRLPTGIFYAQGVKANVLFFDRKPAAADPWTKDDVGVRPAHQHALHAEDQAAAGSRPRRLRRRLLPRATESKRVESERFRRFGYDELIARDKANLDITWLRDDTLDDASTLPAPGGARRRDRRRARSRPRPVHRAGGDPAGHHGRHRNQRVMSINKAYLLGAGASMDAGLPLASGITSLALEHLNDNSQPSERDLAGVLNFVVAAMVAHAARHGGRPDQFPDIESVVSAVDLLASRSDVELTPFVQSWDPGVLSASRGRDANARTAVRKMREAIEAPRELFAERPFSEAFDLMLDDRLGSDSGHLFKRLNVALMRMLLTILQTPEATRLAYLQPLVDLGAGTDGVTVATLNYDLTVETAAAEHGIALSTGVDDWLFKGRVDFPADGIRLIKLHGSVGWTAAAPTATGLRLKPEPFDPRPPIPSSLETPAVIYGKRGKLRGDGPYLDLRGAFARALSQSSVWWLSAIPSAMTTSTP